MPIIFSTQKIYILYSPFFVFGNFTLQKTPGEFHICRFNFERYTTHSATTCFYQLDAFPWSARTQNKDTNLGHFEKKRNEEKRKAKKPKKKRHIYSVWNSTLQFFTAVLANEAMECCPRAFIVEGSLFAFNSA